MPKKDDICTLKIGRLSGVQVEVLRQSKISGDFTVKLLEDAKNAPAYTAGTELAVHGYELSPT